MQCQDVRKQLKISAQLSRLPESVKAHLLECPACRQTQALYAAIEQELQDQPIWQPPPEFVERVGLRGLASLSGTPAKQRSLFSWGTTWPAVAASLPSLLLGLLAAVFSFLVLLNWNALVAGYRHLVPEFSKALLANAIPMAWATAVLSLWVTGWLTRRALR